MGELDVAGIALEHMHRQTGPFRQRAVVGEVVATAAAAPGDALRAGAESGRPAGSARPASAERSGVERTWDRAPITLIVSVTGVPGTAAPRAPRPRSRGRSDRGRRRAGRHRGSGRYRGRGPPAPQARCAPNPAASRRQGRDGRTADEASGKAERRCFIQIPVIGMDHHDRPADATGERRTPRASARETGWPRSGGTASGFLARLAIRGLRQR